MLEVRFGLRSGGPVGLRGCFSPHKDVCVPLTEVGIKGSVLSSLGLSLSDRNPLKPTDSTSKNAFGMLKQRSK